MVNDMVAARLRDNLAWRSAHAPSHSTAGAAPRLTTDQLVAQVHRIWPLRAEDFGRGLYRLLLGRDPSAVELDRVVEHVHAGHPRLEIVRRLSADREVLDRGIEPSWFGTLVCSHSPEAVWNELLLCWCQPADRFVRRLYELLLLRTADPEGLSAHVAGLGRGRRRADIVREFVASEEFARGGLEALWLDRLVLLTPEGLRTELRARRAAPDDRFVRGLFESVLFRKPSPAEQETHLQILAAGTPRGQMIRAVLACDEAQGRYAGPEWAGVESDFGPGPDGSPHTAAELLGVPDRNQFVREAYRAVLGRYPTPAELARQVRRFRYLPFYTRSLMLRRLSRTWEAELYRRSRAAEEAAAALRPGSTPQSAGAEGGRLQRLVEELAREQRALSQQLGSVAGRVNECAGRVGSLERSAADHFARRDEADVEVRRAFDRESGEVRRQLQQLEQSVAGRVDELAGRLGSLERSEEVARQSDELRRELQQLEQTVGAVLSEDPGGVRWRLQRLEQAVGSSAAALVTEQQKLREAQEVMREEHRRHAFAEQAWYDQLRRLGAAVAEHTGTPSPAPAPPATTKAERCRVCGGELSFRWVGRVLHNRYEAEYHECRACGALQVPDPHWLPEAYRGEAAPQLWNPDVGRFRRNFSVYCHLRALVAAGLAGGRPRVLDYGGGYGLLTQMLLDAGLDAWTFDPHVGRPFFAPDRLLTGPDAVPAGSFDLVTAFEVFEHLTDPAQVGALLGRVLAPTGAVVLSTELYEPGVHGPDWHYLSYEAGQHVLFWTRRALRVFAGRYGFQSVGLFPDGPFRCAVLSPAPAADLAALLDRAATEFAAAGFSGDVTRPWQVIPPGDPAVQPAADVEPAIEANGGRP